MANRFPEALPPAPVQFPVAVYRKQEVARYRGNPFIEALEPIIDDGEAIIRMQRLVEATPEQRAMPAHLRMHELGEVEEFFQPLDVHVELFHKLSRLLRSGYVRRNPLNPGFIRDMEAWLEVLDRRARAGAAPPTPQGGAARAGGSLTLLGYSGVGKTWAVEAGFRTYQQVWYHPDLKGPLGAVLQLVHLRVTCPEDVSVKGLCVAFFEAVDAVLGTRYTAQYVNNASTVDSLRVAMARVAFLHGLGVLVIDEVQHLNQAKSGGAERCKDFFKLLPDVMRIPVLLVGTEEAADILGVDVQGARRHSGLPLFMPMPLYGVGTRTIDPGYRLFCESLFQAQFLRARVEVTDELLVFLHGLTLGLPAIVVMLFVLAQDRGLALEACSPAPDPASGGDGLSQRLLQTVFDDCFGLLKPHLDAMREGKTLSSLDYSQAIKDLRKQREQLRGLAATVAPETGRPATARSHAGPPLVPPLPVPSAPAEAASGVPAKARPRIRKAQQAAPDRPATLVDIVKGQAGKLSGYEALRLAGFVRPLGAEVIAEARAKLPGTSARPMGDAAPG